MDSALVVSQIVLVTACITALVTLEFLFFGLVVMSFFMPVQPCFTLEDLRAQLTLPLFALPKVMLSLHVPLIGGGIGFDLAQFMRKEDYMKELRADESHQGPLKIIRLPSCDVPDIGNLTSETPLTLRQYPFHGPGPTRTDETA